VTDRDVFVGIRPEGFVLNAEGAFTCDLVGVEVMGRDISVIAKNAASGENIRAIISSENIADVTGTVVRFDVKPNKLFIFDKETEARIEF